MSFVIDVIRHWAEGRGSGIKVMGRERAGGPVDCSPVREGRVCECTKDSEPRRGGTTNGVPVQSYAVPPYGEVRGYAMHAAHMT